MNKLPTIGSRIDYAGHHGTVRYIGEVINSSGIWLGVEWDDPQRGRHDGVKDGIRYFQCQVPVSGSFLRPSAKIFLGRSVLDALSSKYIEALHSSGSQETVTLGSSNGAIEVEAVDLDKIRARLADLGRLREVSLDKENVSGSDPPGAIRETCPNIRGLDLSNSLVPSWDVIAQITSELPNLERLALNRTRLAQPTDTRRFNNAFPNLVELHLNRTMINWFDMMLVASVMPRLRIVEMGFNQLTQLHTTDELAATSGIQNVNLGGNFCNDWVHICDCFGKYSSLQRVVLTCNGLEIIPFPAASAGRIGVKHLALSSNELKSWHDIDALSLWCPNLETLSLTGNPLSKDKNFRPIAVARIASLTALNGSPISQKERNDCELFCLSHFIKDASKAPDQLVHEHARWEQLRLKHGQMEVNTDQKTGLGKLRAYIIGLKVYPVAAGTSIGTGKFSPLEPSSCVTLRVLPSMTLRVLRVKISKAVKGRTGGYKVRIWQRMHDGVLAELDSEQDAKDLSWLGLEDGTTIVCTFDDG